MKEYNHNSERDAEKSLNNLQKTQELISPMKKFINDQTYFGESIKERVLSRNARKLNNELKSNSDLISYYTKGNYYSLANSYNRAKLKSRNTGNLSNNISSNKSDIEGLINSRSNIYKPEDTSQRKNNTVEERQIRSELNSSKKVNETEILESDIIVSPVRMHLGIELKSTSSSKKKTYLSKALNEINRDLSFKTPYNNQAISFEYQRELASKVAKDKQEYVNAINMSTEAINYQHPRVPEQVKIGSVIGKGSFATVFNGIDIETEKEIAVKIYEKKELLKPERLKFVENELKVLSQINHPHIVEFHKMLQDSKAVFLLQEKCSEKSLSQYVRDSKHKKLPEHKAREVFSQLASAMSYLHDKKICHRDLKLTNILVTFPESENLSIKNGDISGSPNRRPSSSINVKLIDFGFSMFCDKKYRTYCGTPSYMAPELINREAYNGLSLDIWALGVILYKILTGEYPFGTEDEGILMETRIRKGIVNFPLYLTDKSKDLIERCFNLVPELRITAKEIEQHDWLKSSTDSAKAIFKD